MIDERQDTGTQAGTLRDLLAILFKHKAKIAVIFFVVVIAVTVISFVMAPTYEARSTVLVKYGREYLYRPEVGGDKNQVISSGHSSDEILNSEIEIILNRDLMDKVVSVVGAEKLYPELVGKKNAKDAAIGRVTGHLKVEGIKKSNVLTVSFRHQDPDLAAQVVNLLVDKFREKHLQVYSDPKSSFLEEQLAEYSQKFKTSENDLQAFKQTRAVYSLDEQRNLLLRQRMELDTAYKETQNKIEELQGKLRSLTAQARALA